MLDNTTYIYLLFLSLYLNRMIDVMIMSQCGDADNSIETDQSP